MEGQMPTKMFFDMTLWVLLLAGMIGTVLFLDRLKLSPAVPEYPNEIQATLIAEYTGANTPSIFTNKEGQQGYRYTDGFWEDAATATRTKDGEPILTPKQQKTVAEQSTMVPPTYVQLATSEVTVKDYNEHIVNIQGMFIFGCITGFAIGLLVSIARGHWLHMVVAEVGILSLAILGVLLPNLLLMVFGFAAVLIVPFSYLSFSGQEPAYQKK